MAVPIDWRITYVLNPPQSGGGFLSASDPRAICPHCRNASTFTIRAQQFDTQPDGRTTLYLILQCNSASCRKTVYVQTSVRKGHTQNQPQDDFFMFPSIAIGDAHPSIPATIAEDWQEAQRSIQAAAPKAAAVMLRRVMYGVLLDKQCKLHPLHEGMQQLIVQQRLPGIFDEWLPAIRDDGHDAAHPDRALSVSSENVGETLEYTSELLRFLYIEPYEFQMRKSRNTPPQSGVIAAPAVKV